MNIITFASHISWQLIPNQNFAFAYNVKTKQYYKFRETAMVIWMCIYENEPINQIDLISKVANYYKIGSEVIEADVKEFIASLYEKGLVEYNGRDIYQERICEE